MQNLSKRGYGITFVDIDETIFHTFAKIKVIKENKVVRELTNQEYNTYKLKEGEHFDYSQFKDAELFDETSIPIPQTVNRIKQMTSRIKETKSYSRIIFLTARVDFPDKTKFLDAFIRQGIDVDNTNIIYIERAGNINEGTIAEKKRKIILKHLHSGKYRRCRMIDDDPENLRMFIELGENIPKEILDNVRKKYALGLKEKPIEFYPLQIMPDGKLKEIGSK